MLVSKVREQERRSLSKADGISSCWFKKDREDRVGVGRRGSVGGGLGHVGEHKVSFRHKGQLTACVHVWHDQ